MKYYIKKYCSPVRIIAVIALLIAVHFMYQFTKIPDVHVFVLYSCTNCKEKVTDDWAKSTKDLTRAKQIQVEAVTYSNNISGTKFKITLPDLRNAELKKSIEAYDKQFDNSYAIPLLNTHGVKYPLGKFDGTLTKNNVLCKVKLALPIVLGQDTVPFKEMGLAKYFPEQSIYEKYRYERCAVVSSSIFMRGSSFGKEIDSHDAVVRFNSAPTDGFEKDVGEKTTFRIINGDVCFSDYADGSDSMFHNTTLLMWWTGPYNGNLYR
ncbi:beta-galactoside alpha-2,6-sialyltransferase 2-like, partial [Saccoglossus kowalevskii]